MDTNKTKELISLGAEITGATTGSVIGFITAGPIGAVGGAIAGPFLTKGLEIVADFALRNLSHREKVKAGAGLSFAYRKIMQYLEAGKIPRDDGFFDKDYSGRSASDEILEGVLIKCKNEHEEKKLRLIGNIYANVAFMSDISIAGANWLLQKGEELTYRELCIISLIKRRNARGASWGPSDGDPAFEMEYKHIEAFIYRDHSSRAVEHHNKTGEALPILGLSRIGEFCYIAMGLDEIPEADVITLAPRFPNAFKTSTAT
jgi:hypothetical protein